MQRRRVLLLGATGLVGRELLTQLLADSEVESVRVVARRSTAISSPKLEEKIIPLDEMAQHAEFFAVDAIFCALGTTIKVAGSQEKFRVVDHDYPLAAARLGREQNAQHYLLVSATGANATSRIFYNRVKGEVERDILQLGYPHTTIARPALLLGERDEYRLGERIFEHLGWLMPRAWKPIAGRDVARALIASAHEPNGSVEILESRAMQPR
jgi:uncharacterized protein YbjT (DUF2867 family)